MSMMKSIYTDSIVWLMRSSSIHVLYDISYIVCVEKDLMPDFQHEHFSYLLQNNTYEHHSVPMCSAFQSSHSVWSRDRSTNSHIETSMKQQGKII